MKKGRLYGTGRYYSDKPCRHMRLWRQEQREEGAGANHGKLWDCKAMGTKVSLYKVRCYVSPAARIQATRSKGRHRKARGLKHQPFLKDVQRDMLCQPSCRILCVRANLAKERKSEER